MGTAGHQETPRDAGDELDPLPPLDGDAADPSEVPVAADDDLPGRDEGGEVGDLDDSTPAGDGRDADVDGSELADSSASERGWLDEPSDNHGLDIGGYDLAHGTLDRSDEKGDRATSGVRGADESEDVPAADDDFAIGERAGALDPLAEDGPVDPDEELRDEDLPALDADEQDVGGDDVALLDERLARGESNEPAGVPWASAPWASVGAPVGLRGVSALACVPRGVLVASRHGGGDPALVLVDLEGGKETLAAGEMAPGVVRQIAAHGTSVVALLERTAAKGVENGGLFFARNIADGFEALDGGADAERLALTSMGAWAATRSGGLVSIPIPGARSPDGGPPGSRAALVRHEVPGSVRALGTDGTGGIVALAVDAARIPAALVRGSADRSIRWEGIELPSAPVAQARLGAEPLREPVIAARGAVVAIALCGKVFRRDGRGAWHRTTLDGTVTALAFVDEEGTLLVATHSRVEAATALIRIDSSGRSAVVALVGAPPDDPDSDGCAHALAWDDARGVVWLAGSFGIAAFARPTKV